MEANAGHPLPRVPTGIAGLDVLLGGGLPEGKFILLHGAPGTGKTTTAVQFLLHGAARGETCLFIALGNSEEQLRSLAASHAWSLDGIDVRELPVDRLFSPEQTLFPSQQVELTRFTEWVRGLIEEFRPQRLVIDTIAYLRALAHEASRYRTELILLRRLLEERGVTAVVIDADDTELDATIRALTDGIIHLEQLHPKYGGQRYRLHVVKMRHIRFHGGYHDFVIRPDGVEVFPRVIPSPERHRTSWTTVSSGDPTLDAMLGGGFASGTACMLVGPSGSGKSTLSNLCADRLLRRERRVAVFLLEERLEMFFQRTTGIGLRLEDAQRAGLLDVQKIDPGTVSPGEFGQRVRDAAEAGAELVVIDSLTGYLSVMQEEAMLVTQLHDLFSFLAQNDVLVLFTVEQHGLVGELLTTPMRISEMADTVLLLRYGESQGGIHKTVTVLKKRHGGHEKGARELRIDDHGVSVGERNPEFRNLLSSTLDLPE